MSDLATRIELGSLARALGVDEAEVEFLSACTTQDVRALRDAVTSALVARNEPRLKRVAVLSGMLPAALSAKLAATSLGPVLSARVASVLPTAEAVRLAKQFSPAFLADLAVHLDPGRLQELLPALPEALLVDVGRRLLRKGEHITLGRVVSVVSVETALGVIEIADGSDLLKVAIFTEGVSALDAVLARLDDQALVGVIAAADAEGAYDDAAALVMSLAPENSQRLVGLVGEVDHAEELILKLGAAFAARNS